MSTQTQKTDKVTEAFISMTDVIEMFSVVFGKRPHHYTIRKLVDEKGLKAYKNPLKQVRGGKPPLSFLRSEVASWLEASTQAITPKK